MFLCLFALHMVLVGHWATRRSQRESPLIVLVREKGESSEKSTKEGEPVYGSPVQDIPQSLVHTTPVKISRSLVSRSFAADQSTCRRVATLHCCSLLPTSTLVLSVCFHYLSLRHLGIQESCSRCT